MTQNDLDKLVKYVSITLSHAHSIPLDIYLNDVVDFCKLNLMEEINEGELDELANEYFYSLERDNGIRSHFKAGYRAALKQ